MISTQVLYKRALVEPFLDALEAALAPGGRALLCHLPRAGVSHEVVEAALRAREAAGGPALAAVRAPVSAEFGDDCNADDAAAARVYELCLPAADDDADARRSGAARKSNVRCPTLSTQVAFRGPRVKSRESRRSKRGPDSVPWLRRRAGVSLRPARGRRLSERRGRRRAGAAARRVGGSRDGDISDSHTSGGGGTLKKILTMST